MYNLPKGYLSYSAMDLWIKNPGQFRKKYYEHIYEPGSPQMAFGKHIATLLENADASMAHIPQYAQPEYPIDLTIEGVRFKGYIDSFDPERNKLLEFKTGVVPWDAVRVRKHLQLTLYSMAVELLHGSVDDECHLVWLQTEKVVGKKMGLVAHEDSHTVKLTGKVEIFPRVIKKWERTRAKKQLLEIAKNISTDYSAYQKKMCTLGMKA